MSKTLSAKYYQENKEKLQKNKKNNKKQNKKNKLKYQNLSKEEKKKAAIWL